jgi:hypothetical protein
MVRPRIAFKEREVYPKRHQGREARKEITVMMVAEHMLERDRTIAAREWEYSTVSEEDANTRFTAMFAGQAQSTATIFMVKRERGSDVVFPVYVVYRGAKPKLPWVLKEVQQAIRPVNLASRSQIEEYTSARV